MAVSMPTLKLAQDDNLAIYTRSDTTLILAAKTYAITQSKFDELKTRRILVYANVVQLGGRTSFPGKEVQIHCNHLQWADGTVLSVSGTAGKQTAAVGPQPEANGGDAGLVYLHVHNLPLVQVPGGFTFWPKSLNFEAQGGAAGQYHKDSTTWESGKQGQPGSVTIYYSHADLRSFASSYDLYFMQASHPDRMRTILKQVIPKLKNTSAAYKNTATDVEKLESLLTALLNFHVTLTKCTESLSNLELPASARQKARDLLSTTHKLPELRDYSVIDPKAHEQATNLLDGLLKLGGETGAVEDAEAIMQHLVGLHQTLKSAVEAEKSDTPLSILIIGIFKTFWSIETEKRGKATANVTPEGVLSMRPVTYSVSGADDLAAKVPLVHPDQCQMEMRIADAAYFASEFDTATAGYNNLRERLSFVPLLQKNLHETTKGKDPTALLAAFRRLEEVDRLSYWTMDSLSSLYTQVCGRLEQLSMGRDLFGLSSDWAPRLSTQYYIEYAQQQIGRLRILEASYWKYFDNYQEQMENGAILKEAQAANVYRRKEARDTLAATLRLMRDKETAIENAAKDIETKRVKLVADLGKAQKSLKKLRMPSAASFLTALSACVVTGIALASNPVGWVAGIGLAAMALTPQGLSLFDEATSSIEDSHGQRVNKKYVINKMTKCEDDLKSLLAQPAYSMKADGTKIENSEDSAKIAVTEEQLKSFLQQFQDTIGSDDQHLGNALRDSLNAFTKATNTRNQDILAYSNAVIQAYELMKQQALLESQAGDISSQLIKENTGLPSIVAYYQRFREVSRVSILSSIKHSALALRFWGLSDAIKFTVGLMSPLDELEAHVDVLMKEHGAVLANIGSFPQSSWPESREKLGILYKLSDAELSALKLGPTDPFADPTAKTRFRMYTIAIDTLMRPATLRSSILETPFAGMANVRLSQVRVWLPGLRVGRATQTSEPKSSVLVEIKQEGTESFASPDNKLLTFRHSPVYMNFQYDWRALKTAGDIHADHVVASHALATDWLGSNLNARVQAPIGPFATWAITIRERDNGPLNFTDVKEAYIEFHGSGFAFGR